MDSIRLRFIADRHFVDAVKTSAAQYPHAVQIVDETIEQDVSRLGFDLNEIVSIITIISGVMQVVSFAREFLSWRETSAANKVIIESSTKTIVLRKDEKVSTEDMVRLIRNIEDDE